MSNTSLPPMTREDAWNFLCAHNNNFDIVDNDIDNLNVDHLSGQIDILADIVEEDTDDVKDWLTRQVHATINKNMTVESIINTAMDADEQYDDSDIDVVVSIGDEYYFIKDAFLAEPGMLDDNESPLMVLYI